MPAIVNDQDYVREGPPLIAVIGDSFIEAQMVPYAETLQGRLAAALAGKFRVYSIAASGAPLSQYLVFAGHAVRDYGAGAAVINVVGNDFDESLAAYKLGPGFWLYAPDASGTLRLRLTEHEPGATDHACAPQRARALCHHQPALPGKPWTPARACCRQRRAGRPMLHRAMPAIPTRQPIDSG